MENLRRHPRIVAHITGKVDGRRTAAPELALDRVPLRHSHVPCALVQHASLLPLNVDLVSPRRSRPLAVRGDN